MKSDIIHEYESALDRLIENKTIRVPIGTKISNDSVSLESGRGKGSIKKGRECFQELITKIHAAAEAQRNQKEQKSRAHDIQDRSYRELYLESIARELMLISQIDSLEKTISNSSNVTKLKRG